MINWLKKNKDIINLTGIEVRLEIPLTTLSQVIREKKPIDLPKKWIEPLRELAQKMNYDDNDSFIEMARKPEDFKIKKGKSKLDLKSMVDNQKNKKK